VLLVNPDEGGGLHRGITLMGGEPFIRKGGGWHEIVHSMSHYAADRLYPRSGSGHSAQHAWMEREMIQHVVRSGWLEGKLRRPAREPKPKPDRKLVERDRAAASLKRWQTKRKRAETAIRKLQAKMRRQERALLAQPPQPSA
jgi:hypothetical protein